jgi:WD40 repeat protein
MVPPLIPPPPLKPPNRQPITHINASYRPLLASADTRGAVLLWDFRTASLVKTLADTPRGAIADLAWAPPLAETLAVVAAAAVTLWNVRTGAKVWRKEFSDAVLCVSGGGGGG